MCLIRVVNGKHSVGRRHSSLLKSVIIEVPVYTILEVYRVSDMELVRVLPSAEDEVNVACFHPAVKLLTFSVCKSSVNWQACVQLKVLGVETTTTQQEIKRAYHKLALRLHPNKNPGDEVIGYKTKTTINLRLWSTKVASSEFDLNAYNAGEHTKAYEALKKAEKCRASDFPRDYDGACVQMRMSYSTAAHLFLFLVQWTDCHLAGAFGLLRILIYKVYVDGTTTMSIHERKASIRDFMRH
ncbi:hypothetical protein POM88_040508 [Heracleum sosnowskyi]|uniref:J domain-containing protein n=1 Tax=Heracleum sosnowskyi TaxID=360622 RepID=A0AAD8HF42_9APIA|nr:hypothetical protein POM88_040508 [Heracleum sosnowskyi]